MKFFALFLLTIHLPTLCNGLWCYSCSDDGCEKPRQVDCNVMDKCGNVTNYYCYTVSGIKKEQTVVSKSCISEADAKSRFKGKANRPDCFTIKYEGVIRATVCLCDKDMCNSGETKSLFRVSWFIPGFPLLLYIIQ